MKKKFGRPPVHSTETIQRIYELYDTTDKGYVLISQELDISRHTVRYYIHKRNKENAADVNTSAA